MLRDERMDRKAVSVNYISDDAIPCQPVTGPVMQEAVPGAFRAGDYLFCFTAALA